MSFIHSVTVSIFCTDYNIVLHSAFVIRLDLSPSRKVLQVLIDSVHTSERKCLNGQSLQKKGPPLTHSKTTFSVLDNDMSRDTFVSFIHLIDQEGFFTKSHFVYH